MTDENTPPDSQPPFSRRWRWFLLAWSIFTLSVLVALWFWGASAFREQVFIVNDHDPTWKAWWDAARRNLVLAHLSFYRVYPWILLAPYVLWVASRFNLEHGHFRRHFFAQSFFAIGFVAVCQIVNGHIAADRPQRLVISVKETSISNSLPVGSSTDVIKHVLQELRFSDSTNFDLPRPIGDGGSEDVKLTTASDPSNATFLEKKDLNWHGDSGNPPPGDLMSRPHPDFPVHFPFRSGNQLPSLALDLFVFVSFSGLGHAIHFRRRFQERERRTIALESSLARARLHALQAQLQPHFLFNTLNSITALVRQNPAAAEEMLTSLSDLLRMALHHAGQIQTSLREELRILQAYIDIQQTRFGEKLEYEQAIDPRALDAAVPGLLLQPLVENAIRHGLEPSERNGIVRITGGLDNDALVLTVEDSGVGSAELVGGGARPGVGLSNVRDRLHALFGESAQLNFAQSALGGLAVRIRLPFRTADLSTSPHTA